MSQQQPIPYYPPCFTHCESGWLPSDGYTEKIEGVTPMYLIPTQWVACHGCNWMTGWPQCLNGTVWAERCGKGLHLFVSGDGFERTQQIWLGPKGIGELRRFLG